jgi:hypothetical protein
VVRVFISYRRSDTGGRAGRLRDGLAARFGERNVFHDLSALVPGAAFDEEIGERIAACDVVLVLIGPGWTADADAGGGRRLFMPDDYVRREVREALACGKRIVPVLVDGARLPSASELPDDVAPLVRRHAFTLRDESWQQDVGELIRRLDREPERSERRPWARPGVVALLGGSGAAVLAAVLIVTLGDDAGGSADDDLPSCEPVDASWVAVGDGDGDGVAVDGVVDGEPARFEPRSARYRPDGDGWLVVVEVAVTSTGASTGGDGVYLSEAIVDALLVDGVEAEQVVCASVVGDPQILPGRTAIGLLGFQSPLDPTGAMIGLAADDGGTIWFGSG